MSIFYIDMDDVLANFSAEKNGRERYLKEQSFFKFLRPIWVNIRATNCLIKNGEQVFVITKSPHRAADKAKREWLKRFIPELSRSNVIIVREGQEKTKLMKTPNGILFDDYGKNCLEWETKKGNIAYKITKDSPIGSFIDLEY